MTLDDSPGLRISSAKYRGEQNIALVFDKSAQDRGCTVCCVVDDEDDEDQKYKLSCIDVPTAPDAESVPEELLRHLNVILPAYLQASPTNEIHVIVSTKSGTGLALRCWQSVLEPLLKLAQESLARPTSPTDHAVRVDGRDPCPYHVVITEDAHSVRDFARNELAGSSGGENESASSKTIILLSGDGGIADLLNGVATTEHNHANGPAPIVALLPLGTGNALFNSLHRPFRDPGPNDFPPIIRGLRTLFRGRPAPLPIFRATFSPGARIVSFHGDPNSHIEKATQPITQLLGAVVASYGFHASIVAESDTPFYRKYGDKRFGIVAEELLRVNHTYNATVEVRYPGATAPRTLGGSEHAYVLSTMVSNLERSFTISPHSHPLDGKFRLIHFGPVGAGRMMDIMGKAYEEGAHIEVDGVGYDEVEELKVTVLDEDARWRKFCIDGTIVEVEQGGWMAVRRAERSPLQILVDPTVL